MINYQNNWKRNSPYSNIPTMFSLLVKNFQSESVQQQWVCNKGQVKFERLCGCHSIKTLHTETKRQSLPSDNEIQSVLCGCTERMTLSLSYCKGLTSRYTMRWFMFLFVQHKLNCIKITLMSVKQWSFHLSSYICIVTNCATFNQCTKLNILLKWISPRHFSNSLP